MRVGVALLAIAAVAGAAAGALGTPHDELPVWGLMVCGPYAVDDAEADRVRCRYVTPVDLDRATCTPIERAVQARFKAAGYVRCVADPERLWRRLPLR